MAYIKFPIKDFPSVSKFNVGDKVEISLEGTISLKMLGAGDDFVTLEINEIEVEKEEVKEHPAEIMKRMLELQGMQSVAQP